MAEIVIYTKDNCIYCEWAKRLLDQKGLSYQEKYVTHSEEGQRLREEMVTKSNGGRTFPQIFIDGRSIGGFDNLQQLAAKGELDF
jgi:glutaredoxin 3